MMLKDILVQIDAAPATATRLDLAISLARKHGAHLIGLCVFDIGLVPGAGFGVLDPENTLALVQFEAKLRDEALAIAANLAERFDERVRRDGVQGEWRMVEGRAVVNVALHARYADLAILGQENPDDLGVTGWTPVLEAALLTSGRPILVVPYAGHFEQVGHRVLIGWNAHREAARAVHDALALIRGAQSVTVLAVDPDQGAVGHGQEPAADLSRHLARHGLRVTAKQTTSGELDPTDVLLNYAADESCDLIVVGGYGHSRMREIVLGGVTRGLLQRATVPVLMSH